MELEDFLIRFASDYRKGEEDRLRKIYKFIGNDLLIMDKGLLANAFSLYSIIGQQLVDDDNRLVIVNKDNFDMVFIEYRDEISAMINRIEKSYDTSSRLLDYYQVILNILDRDQFDFLDSVDDYNQNDY